MNYVKVVFAPPPTGYIGNNKCISRINDTFIEFPISVLLNSVFLSIINVVFAFKQTVMKHIYFFKDIDNPMQIYSNEYYHA